jgi:signal transduction histidine kinase
LQSLADQFDSTLEIELDLDSDIAAMERQSTGLIAEDVRLASYRIAEEAMSNVVKHSKAKSVTIRLNVDQDLLVLVIEDDGTGFEGSPAAGSLGLAVMTDYAQAVGGECSFESVPGRGTTIFARLPIR